MKILGCGAKFNPTFYSERRILRLSCVFWLNQQGRDDVATFARQNVVCAACGQRIHGFKAYSLRHQSSQIGWGRKSQARTTAKNNQFRLQVCQLRKVLCSELFKSRAIPCKFFAA